MPVERRREAARAGDRGDDAVREAVTAGGADAEGRVEAVGVEAVRRALAAQLAGIERAREQREDEGVPALLLLERLLELDLPVRGGDHVHRLVRPQPERLREREHARHVGTALAGELAEARPHARDRHAIRVQHEVDGHALLGALAADGGSARELVRRRRAQLAQRRQRACDVPADGRRERVSRQPPEVGDLLADPVGDPLHEGIELRVDLLHEALHDPGGRGRRRRPGGNDHGRESTAAGVLPPRAARRTGPPGARARPGSRAPRGRTARRRRSGRRA